MAQDETREDGDAGEAAEATTEFVTFLVAVEESAFGTFFRTEVPAQTGGFRWLRVSPNTPGRREAMARAQGDQRRVRVQVGPPEKPSPDGSPAPTVYAVAVLGS